MRIRSLNLLMNYHIWKLIVHRNTGKPMQAAIEETLYQAGVDLVLSGHVHAYERWYRGISAFQYTAHRNNHNIVSKFSSITPDN